LILALYDHGFAPLLGRRLLVLTTTGRVSGLPRRTPLQFEEVDGRILVAAGWGPQSDWYRNLQAHPIVEVRIGTRRLQAVAHPTSDPASIADFLELRLSRHPGMVGRILQSEGLPARPTHAQLVEYAAGLGMVILQPLTQDGSDSDAGRRTAA
jgi:deazaflavin-dependent oxidoreductase (nitroreductase family)